MRVVIKGKNTLLTPPIKKYIEQKLIRPTEKLLGGRAQEDVLLELELARTTRHHRKGQVWFAEANLKLGKHLIRAEHEGEGAHEVIDLVENELTREIKSFKERSKTKEIRGARKLKRMLKRV